MDPMKEPETKPSKPQFAEMAEEASYTPLPRDFSSDFGGGPRASAVLEEHYAAPAKILFADPDEAAFRELDTPTFLRRFQF